MDSQPVFGSSEEYHTWKVLQGKVSGKLLSSIVERIMAGGHVHPAILISLIDALAARPEGIQTSMLISLAEKARPQDISPIVKISEMLIEKNEMSAAANILSNCESKDVFHRSLAEAELYQSMGDREMAVRSARKAYENDPSCAKAYEILDRDDPDGGWKDRSLVQAAYEKREAEPPSSPRFRQLYEIYRDWFSGNKDSATDKLISSEYYSKGDPDFLLASARMSADEKDWRSAKMMYDRIIDVSPPFVTYEAAEAYTMGHDPVYALELYDRLDQTSLRCLKGREAAYKMMGSDKDVRNAIYDYLDNEYVGTKEYSECIDTLLDSDKLDNAKRLLDFMARSNSKDPSYLICYTKYLIKTGNIRGARITAMRAVKQSKGDISALIILARVKLVSGNLKDAEKECKKALSIEPDNVEALILKKDILIQKHQTDEALEICRKILASRPYDIPTLITMSDAQKAAGDLNGCGMTLRRIIDLDPCRENVLEVASFMIGAGMYREAMYLCYDMEKIIPADPMLRRLRGNAEYNLGEYVKASVSFASAAEIDPNDPVLWHSKGMADEARGDLESAEVAYNRAVLLDLSESEYWMSKASIQEKFGDKHGAIESLNRAIELEPGSVYPMVRKAIILENDGKYREALYFSEMCLTTAPSDTKVMILDARILREVGKTEDAIAMARQAHNLEGSEDSAIELANCLTASGRRTEAIKIIEAQMVKEDTQRLSDALESIEQGRDEVVLQIPVEKESIIDMEPEEAANLAQSMAAVGDYKGAVRTIDVALAGSGDELKYLVMKIDYLLKMGEIKAANDIVTEALKNNPKTAVLHESMGDVKMYKSEYRGALQEYEKALALGLNIPELLVKKGDAQQKLGFSDRSIDTYTMAVNRDPENRDLRYSLVEKLYEKGYLSRAETQLDAILEKDPHDTQAIVMLARVRKDLRKDAGVTETFNMFRSCHDPGDQAVEKMIAVLESAGHDDEAKILRKDAGGPKEDTRSTRLVEMVLRRSFTSKIPPTDMDLLESLGLDDEQITEVIRFISKEVDFGEIIPGSPVFQNFERLSNKVILSIGDKNFNDGHDLPLEQVFWYSGTKDAEEARRLKAYISKALTCDVRRDDTLKMVLDRVQGMSVYDIMKACKVGVYQARQIQLLLGVKI
ncbi:MAG: tetratricopeptide repeat protein [Thermoplasmata archaeon]|nr:tetratricopeptide repeat protein [Thermoplasmata archaeon]